MSCLRMWHWIWEYYRIATRPIAQSTRWWRRWREKTVVVGNKITSGVTRRSENTARVGDQINRGRDDAAMEMMDAAKMLGNVRKSTGRVLRHNVTLVLAKGTAWACCKDSSSEPRGPLSTNGKELVEKCGCCALLLGNDSVLHNSNISDHRSKSYSLRRPSY